MCLTNYVITSTRCETSILGFVLLIISHARHLVNHIAYVFVCNLYAHRFVVCIFGPSTFFHTQAISQVAPRTAYLVHLMQNHLRDLWSAHPLPERPRKVLLGCRSNRQARAVIEQGRVVFNFATTQLPEADIRRMKETGKPCRVPRGFLGRMLYSLL